MNTHCAKEAKEAAAVIIVVVVVILKEVVNLTECGSKPYLTHTQDGTSPCILLSKLDTMGLILCIG